MRPFLSTRKKRGANIVCGVLSHAYYQARVVWTNGKTANERSASCQQKSAEKLFIIPKMSKKKNARSSDVNFNRFPWDGC